MKYVGLYDNNKDIVTVIKTDGNIVKSNNIITNKSINNK